VVSNIFTILSIILSFAESGKLVQIDKIQSANLAINLNILFSFVGSVILGRNLNHSLSPTIVSFELLSAPAQIIKFHPEIFRLKPSTLVTGKGALPYLDTAEIIDHLDKYF
jgi:hypothetical protein